MRKKILHIVNWEKYQARADKEMPWAKLWGSLFTKEWFQDLPNDLKIMPLIFIDVARRTNNRLSTNPDYYNRNYHLRMTYEDLIKVSKSLKDNEFLSDFLGESLSPSHPTNIQDKTRQDNKIHPATPSPKSVNLKDVSSKLSEPAKHKLYNLLVDTFAIRGWRIDEAFLKPIFSELAKKMNGVQPRELYPYFQQTLKRHINQNAEWLSQSAKSAEVSELAKKTAGEMKNA